MKLPMPKSTILLFLVNAGYYAFLFFGKILADVGGLRLVIILVPLLLAVGLTFLTRDRSQVLFIFLAFLTFLNVVVAGWLLAPGGKGIRSLLYIK
jgi:hypothetical protein